MGQGLFFQPEVRVQIHLCGLHGLVPKPERDHRSIDAMPQELHGRTVSQHMRRDPFTFQRGTMSGRGGRVPRDQALDGIAAERMTSDTGKERVRRRAGLGP